MQPIERYGLVALLLLVVTVVAVVLWDRKNQAESSELAALESSAPSDALPAPALSPLGLPLTQPSSPAGGNYGGVLAAEPNGANAQPNALPVDPALIHSAPVVDPNAQPLVAIAPLIAPAPVNEPVKPVATSTGYRVRSGDTLSSIARRELGNADRWREIAKANPSVDPNRLKVGQALTLPGRAGQASAPSTGPSNAGNELAARNVSRAYTVRPGDSLWTIAATQLGDGGRWREIQALNGNLNGSSLQVGMQLALPSRSASGALVATNGAKPAAKQANKPKAAPTTKLVASESKVR